MADKMKQGTGSARISLIVAVCLAAILSAIGAGSLLGGFGELDQRGMTHLLVGSVVIAGLLGAVGVWAAAGFHSLRRQRRFRNSHVSSAFNHLDHGVVILDAQRRMIYCNDYYLDLYGINRADLFKNITGLGLLALRRATAASSPDEGRNFYRNAGSPDGHVAELDDGRLIVIKYKHLPNGGAIWMHKDCTRERRLTSELATAKTFLESVIDNVPVCIAAKSIDDGRYILANKAFETFSRLSREQLTGKRADELFSAATASAIAKADKAALTSGGHRNEFVVDVGLRKQTLAANRVIARDERGEPAFLIALFQDVTDSNLLSEELEASKKFLEMIVNNIPVSLLVQDARDGRYLLVNRSAETVLNLRLEDAVGKTVSDIFKRKEAEIIIARDQAAMKKGGIQTEEHPIKTTEGLRLFLTRRAIVLGDSGTPKYLIKTHEDVTVRRQTEARMAHMAYHDGLTDLPNRGAFMQALSQMIDACDGVDEEFAVLSIDLDGLKEINDVFGHATGDKVLVEIARRLQTSAGGGLVARLGGDEFGVIIDGVQPEAGLAVARLISEAVEQEFPIDGKSVRAGVTIGISLYPRDAQDAAGLLGNAGAALFRAKSNSRGSISLFEPEMDRQLRDRRVLHQELSAAIHKGELSLQYQPQAHAGHAVNDLEVVGFEALARWFHPTRGFVPPSEFIPLAEESGLIVEMGEWILREACLEAASWPVPMQIAVNLSPAQFMHGDLVGLVQSILNETGLPAGRLELEITEGVLIEDFDRGIALLGKLKALGVRISMDDFGSGYSSLTYLQAFPFDKLKIDRAFVINIGLNRQSPAIVRAVIGLGHALGVTIVAEGVETEEQLHFLTNEGCDCVQGYFIGRPAPIEKYAALVGRIPQQNEVTRMAC